MVEREALLAHVGDLQDQFARASMRAQSKEMLDQHLTIAQFRALMLLAGNEHVPMTEMAHLLGVKANIAAGVVQRLEKRGWATRERDSHDRRVRLAMLTDEGRAAVDAITAEAQRDFMGIMSALDDTQLSQLAGILETLIAARAEPQ